MSDQKFEGGARTDGRERANGHPIPATGSGKVPRQTHLDLGRFISSQRHGMIQKMPLYDKKIFDRLTMSDLTPPKVRSLRVPPERLAFVLAAGERHTAGMSTETDVQRSIGARSLP